MDSVSLPSIKCCWITVRLYEVNFPTSDSSWV
jgi:hypothetical protein